MDNTSRDTFEGVGIRMTQDNLRELPDTVALPSIALPKGGGAIQGIAEKFEVNAFTGTSSFEVPIPISPSRKGVMPALSLRYNSGAGNGAFGLGWTVSLSSIVRKTEKALPHYQDEIESDTFMLTEVEDLVPVLIKNGTDWKQDQSTRVENGNTYTVIRYRPRMEGAYTRIERWVNIANEDTHWRTITATNVHAYYGLTDESRVSDPKDPSRVFEWKLCRMHDDKGSITMYVYKKENGVGIPSQLSEQHRKHTSTQVYLKKVCYGVKTPYYLGETLPEEQDFLFKVVFDYGEHDTSAVIPQHIDQEINDWSVRKDPFSSYRAGFEIRTYRRCQRILIFHCFEASELPHNPYLVKSLVLQYEDNMALSNGSVIEGFSYLTTLRQQGHLWDTEQTQYTTQQLPDFTMQYQPHEWDTTIKKIKKQTLTSPPVGNKDKRHLWVDLYSEGITGILTDTLGGWSYAENLGNGDFAKPQQVISKPSFSGVSKGRLTLMDIAANGEKALVSYGKETPGFFKLNTTKEWKPFTNFKAFPNLSPETDHMRSIDLNGDGLAELLVTYQGKFQWYENAGEKGFEVSHIVAQSLDEEKGPAIVFNDRTQSIFLADMCGDGLTDIVRIRNGEVCYWPNLGYGHFGAKVTMENAPIFEHSDTYNPNRLRLADMDGSGTTDIVYLTPHTFTVWMNQNGNAFVKTPQVINPFPHVNDLADVTVFDLLGTGTACIVYVSVHPQHEEHPIQYIDCMGSKKPHLMTRYENNTGKVVTLTYTASTQLYLKDKKEGQAWISTLPFPVHCVTRVTSTDHIRQTVFTTSYRYRHGYYDPYEREYRGFARVEQWDTETFIDFKVNAALNVVEEALHQPPIKTISWFHTGAFLKGKHHIHQLQEEYFNNVVFAEHQLPEIVIDEVDTPEELREAMRAFKGLPLRVEVYAEDDTKVSPYPYSVTNATFDIKRIQPLQPNKHAVFQVRSSENITYTYERNPADPRISHSIVLTHDELGNALQTATLVYPRVERPVGPNTIPEEVWHTQNQLHIVYDEVSYTQDIMQDTVYRLRVPYERRTYEVNGIIQPPEFYFTKAQFQTQLDTASTIGYEEEFTSGIQKRLSGHKRGYFINEDFTAALPLGTQSPLGLVYRTHSMAFTKNSINEYYGTKVDVAMLLNAGYVHSEGDEHWWTQSNRNLYTAVPEDNFYIPIGVEDIFGNQSWVHYDPYMLLSVGTTNVLGHQVTAVNDYRTLNSILVTDSNQNQTAVTLDALGMVIATAVLGKSGTNEWDTLANPTTRMEYNLLHWQTNKKPNYVHVFSRTQHDQNTPNWKEAYVYSDGGGNMIMTKKQAEPGVALQWNTITQKVEEVQASPRWIGNGRTMVNNKGSVIKRFDPYFSTTHEFEDEKALVETGFSSIHYYDPLGRNTLKENPNGTFSKVKIGPWKFSHFDANDTVIESQWYQDRGAPDPLGPEPFAPEAYAAWTAAKHQNTTTTRYVDTLGKIFYVETDQGNGTISHTRIEGDFMGRQRKSYDQKNRLVSEVYRNMLGKACYSKSAEHGENWTFTDALGRTVQKWDNDRKVLRMTFDRLYRPISTYITPKDEEELLFTHVVYGDILVDAQQRNLIGKPYQVYDQAGVVITQQVDVKGNDLVVERILCEDYKNVIDWTPLEGLSDITSINTAASPFLINEVFTTSATYDALNRPTETVLPDQTRIVPTYNDTNILETLQAQIAGQGPWISFLENQTYTAKGQRESATLGNGLITNYFYDPKTFRLVNLITKAVGNTDAQSLQNLQYTFDPMGNVVYQKDEAQQTHYFNNAVVQPEHRFEYDAIYQLTKATGREHVSLIANSQRDHQSVPVVNQLPHVNNTTAVRQYTETYQYDQLGNIRELKHQAAGGNWTRQYRYAYQDDATNVTNRLSNTSLPGDPINGPFTATYQYDAHGNMIQMPHLNTLVWDLMDRLATVDLGGGGMAHYTYGLGGDRMRKVIERPGGKRMERIYLGSVEIYREYQGNAKKLERTTVHIADDTGTIAQVDTKVLDLETTDTEMSLGQPVIRYQYANHLGSATLETNAEGIPISYEEYHPFGTSAYRSQKSGTNVSLKRYRYSGKERDEETGLYYFGARYYAAWLGRWTSSDPGGYVSGANLYRYCANNPIMQRDLDGMNSGSVVRNDSNRHLADPAQRVAAEAYLEQVYTSRLKPQYADQQVDITEMDFDATRQRWIIHKFRLIPRTDQGTPSTGSTPVVPPTGGDAQGDPQGDPRGTPEGSLDGSIEGTPDGNPEGNPQGSPDGSSDGSPNGTPGGSADGTPGGSPDGTPEGGGDDGSFSFDGGSFLGGLLAGIAVGFIIAAIIITAPISIPTGVAIGLGVAGGGLLAYGSVQSLRRRDMLNRPISNEQANQNLGFGIGGVIGGGLAGPTINGGNQLVRGGAQALGQLGNGGLVPVGVGSGGQGVLSGATTVAGAGTISVPAGTVQVTTGVTQGINIMMMEGGGNGGSSNTDHPSNREFWDLDDAAEAVLGEGAEMGTRIGDIGPVKSEGVKEALRLLGYNPNNFRAIQYNASGPRGNYILTVFEAEGGVYFGPHISSANF